MTDEQGRAARVLTLVRLEVEAERARQVVKYGYEHDLQHNDFEWLGLIAQYAATGNYIAAAALCEAAEEANRMRTR